MGNRQLDWHVDESGLELYSGNSGGDNQVTDEWTARLVNSENPSQINISGYGEGLHWNEETEKFEEYAVTVFIEYRELCDCTSHSDPHEVSCDMEYDNTSSRSYSEDDLEDGTLLSAAKKAVQDYCDNAQLYFSWDGKDAFDAANPR
jgi:hypothetical protein